MKKSLYDYCVENERHDLLDQWDTERNGNLSPKNIAPYSHVKVWWRCEKGHEWQVQVRERTKNNGCPVCAGKVVIPGENDLLSRFPEIAAQWHPAKNGCLAPENVAPFSGKKVWWVCSLGHEYSASVAQRTLLATGCPVCAGKKVLAGFNDLATKDPMLAKQWHPELNGDLTPEMVTVGSAKKVWWQCPEGHEWQAKVYNRTSIRKHGCPVCAGVVRSNSLKRYRAVEIEDKLLNENRDKAL